MENAKRSYGEDLKETISSMIDDVIDQVVDGFAGEMKYADEWDLDGLITYIDQNILPDHDFKQEDILGMTKHEVKELVGRKPMPCMRRGRRNWAAKPCGRLKRPSCCASSIINGWIILTLWISSGMELTCGLMDRRIP